MTKQEISTWFKGLQDSICMSIETLDGTGEFKEDSWERPGGGGGRSRVIQGAVIEKGGVNFSAVHGTLPEKIRASLKVDDPNFFATGVSIVLHPRHPLVPIIHMNVRYFETGEDTWWFGGGIDLTPHYVNPADSKVFHSMLKETCDKHHDNYYPAFKKWADDYFYIKHRKETRGIGGIFFDHLNTQDGFSKEERWKFVQSVGKSFVDLYTTQVKRNINKSFTEQEKLWQLQRRGRYVEFNLVWDRGTKFGLETDGRTESILMSMPPQAEWTYNFQAEPGSKEEETLGLLKKGVDWV
ncbi:MAG: coproporphyrinogen III oxidase [Gammaproteobacteria bacterium]|jgi:coproporphyrinogen III oxidase